MSNKQIMTFTTQLITISVMTMPSVETWLHNFLTIHTQTKQIIITLKYCAHWFLCTLMATSGTASNFQEKKIYKSFYSHKTVCRTYFCIQISITTSWNFRLALISITTSWKFGVFKLQGKNTYCLIYLT